MTTPSIAIEGDGLVERVRSALAEIQDPSIDKYDFPEPANIQQYAGFDEQALTARWRKQGEADAESGRFSVVTNANPMRSLVEEAETAMGKIAGSASHWRERVQGDVADLRQMAQQIENDPGNRQLNEALMSVEDQRWMHGRQFAFSNMLPHISLPVGILLLVISAAALVGDVYFFELTLEAVLKDFSETILFSLAIVITILLGGAAYIAGRVFANGKYTRPGDAKELNPARKSKDVDLRDGAKANRVKGLVLIVGSGVIVLVIGVLRVIEEWTKADRAQAKYDAAVAENAARAVPLPLPAEPDLWGALVLQVVLVLIALLSLGVLFVDGYLSQAKRNRKQFQDKMAEDDRRLADIQQALAAAATLRARADALEDELRLLPHHIADAIRGVMGSIDRLGHAYIDGASSVLTRKNPDHIPNLERQGVPPVTFQNENITAALKLPTVLEAKAALEKGVDA